MPPQRQGAPVEVLNVHKYCNIYIYKITVEHRITRVNSQGLEICLFTPIYFRNREVKIDLMMKVESRRRQGWASSCILLTWLPTTLAAGETKLMLDDMSIFFGDRDGFPETQYEQLVSCFNKFGDSRVLMAQDAAFRKLYETYITGEIRWGEIPTEDKFLESNRSGTSFFVHQLDSTRSKRLAIMSAMLLCTQRRLGYANMIGSHQQKYNQLS